MSQRFNKNAEKMCNKKARGKAARSPVGIMPFIEWRLLLNDSTEMDVPVLFILICTLVI